ncbi:MAG: hypothetical protein HPY44_11060 [Armatimonadetes bacterium]|nr:hypothetical protein [Armatimonadota bacterium]
MAGRREVTFLYVLTSAFFASLLVYGALAFIVESAVDRGEPGSPVLRYAVLGMSVFLLVAITTVERFLLPGETVAAVRTCAIVQAAFADAIAVCGLVLFLTGESIEWFVLHLGLAAAGFIYLATRIPHYSRLMEKYIIESKSGDH